MNTSISAPNMYS